MTRRRAACLSVLCCAVFAVAAAAAIEPPAVYPEFEREGADRLLVVASEHPGAYLPPFPQCEQEGTICMDPPPFWMRVRVQQVVKGELAVPEIAVATTSHYGMPDKMRRPPVYLIDIRTDGRDFVMPRYAKARLYRDRDGEYYLPFLADPVPWLPCSIQTLKREVDGMKLTRDARIPRDYWEVRRVEEHPEWFVLDGDVAMPRYWIPVPALQAHLQTVPATDMQCEAW